MTGILENLAAARRSGKPAGITSVCSAHPVVLRAAIRRAAGGKTPVLIEATCNQVNHLGGYTGMTPRDFVSFVNSIAEEEGLPRELVIFGGDHLGPNPRRKGNGRGGADKSRRHGRGLCDGGFSQDPSRCLDGLRR